PADTDRRHPGCGATGDATPRDQARSAQMSQLPADKVARETDIAVIGVAGRFPEACNAEQYWLNLREGRESVRVASPADLEAAGVPPEVHQDPRYVPAVASPPDIENFDATLFGYTPKEAAYTDPQIRMFLEITHAAL